MDSPVSPLFGALTQVLGGSWLVLMNRRLSEKGEFLQACKKGEFCKIQGLPGCDLTVYIFNFKDFLN